jgi:hypothetical protein
MARETSPPIHETITPVNKTINHPEKVMISHKNPPQKLSFYCEKAFFPSFYSTILKKMDNFAIPFWKRNRN